MTDNYPETIEFDIDRNALRAYLRLKWFLSWLGALAFFGCMMGFAATSDHFDNPDGRGLPVLLALAARNIGIGLLVSATMATFLYFLLSHWRAGRVAASQRVRVEGPFLRIIQDTHVHTDRKLHFRSIVDYTTLNGPLMKKCGIAALHMSTTSGAAQGWVQIQGVKDSQKVRDQLADIDSIRETG